MEKIHARLFIAYPYLFAFLYFILLMFIETSSIHAFQNKSFLLTMEYMKPYLLYSGGIIDYWGLFFTDILEFNLAGAVMYSLLLLLSILLYRQIYAILGVTRNIILTTLLPFILIVLLTFNHFHPVAINLKLITTLLFLNAIVSLPDNKLTIRIFIILLLISLWYLVGIEFFAISLFYVAIISIKRGSVKKDVFVIITPIISVILLNTYLFYTPFRTSLMYILTYESHIPFLLLITYAMFILIPSVAMMKLNVSLNPFLQFGIILIFAIPPGIYSYDAINHNMGKMMAAGNRGDYNKVLKLRDNTSINTRLISAYTNMALLHKGTLLSNMFKYRQDGGTDGLFPSRDFDNFTAFINMKLCFDMGSINPAIRWAMEASTRLGYNTEILRHLILCHLINDNIKAAEKYYVILNKTLFHKNLKKDLEMMLSNYKNGTPDEIILQKRNQRPAGDYYQNNGNKPVNFEWALRVDNNQKALDFYTAICLLNNEYHRLKDIIPKMIEMGYTSIPVHIQEALCIYYAEGHDMPDLSGHEIDRDLIQDCRWFLRTLRQTSDNLFTSDIDRAGRMKYTYWYYLFHISPVTRELNR